MSEAKEDAKASRHMMHDLEEEDSTVLGDEAKPPRRASVGWGAEESDEKGGNHSSAAGGTATAETKRPGRRRKGGEGSSSGGADSKQQRNRHFDDDDREATDIVEIPDLEEEEREPDITTQVAEAPRNTTRSVQTLKELDRDVKFALPNASLVESDESWTFDSLLNDVAQEMQKDLDEREEMLKAEGA
ncbi:hypothetical protein P43SY_000677 [Pythium insidiosum]|uniref:Intraflagellar transport protein 43 n=1 Tax=Pythium insidiosum TaxID=114742 RepID=A0AAD5LU33_PYTIN|nr:hypothetical protein P43SY_000677 [Pythium insidiosum]